MNDEGTTEASPSPSSSHDSSSPPDHNRRSEIENRKSEIENARVDRLPPTIYKGSRSPVAPPRLGFVSPVWTSPGGPPRPVQAGPRRAAVAAPRPVMPASVFVRRDPWCCALPYGPPAMEAVEGIWRASPARAAGRAAGPGPMRPRPEMRLRRCGRTEHNTGWTPGEGPRASPAAAANEESRP